MMTNSQVESIETNLTAQATRLQLPENHLRNLLKNNNRLRQFSRYGGGLLYDFSRQRMDRAVFEELVRRSEAASVIKRFRAMTTGEEVNITEKRAALHTAMREFEAAPLILNGRNVTNDISSIRSLMRRFADDVRGGKIRAENGRPFTDVIVVGIGGSYLGTEFVSTALASAADDNKMRLHFLSNVDIDNLGRIIHRINPQTALWVIISKSYTTAETIANAEQTSAFLRSKGIDPARHTVTVTSEGSPGDDPAHPCLASFHMFDFIGGRYSVTSAVGGVPLSLYLGYNQYERFLRGANEMDQHACQAPPEKNIPLIAALVSVWNSRFLEYSAQAIIPYSSALAKLPAHIQQLNMESNGKNVDADGRVFDGHAGTIIFGEPGTNAQHSFFQLAHQGRPFPVEFIGILRPAYGQYDGITSSVSNHQELWANMIAQADALARGKTHQDPSRSFDGNRPSSTILLENLSPENIGRLLSFYEAKTVFEAFLLGINPFDQFGVELGKKVASGIREEISRKNHDETYDFSESNETTRCYLDFLFSGKLAE